MSHPVDLWRTQPIPAHFVFNAFCKTRTGLPRECFVSATSGRPRTRERDYGICTCSISTLRDVPCTAWPQEFWTFAAALDTMRTAASTDVAHKQREVLLPLLTAYLTRAVQFRMPRNVEKENEFFFQETNFTHRRLPLKMCQICSVHRICSIYR